ncbi:MAG: YqhA family protein [Longimicrobiales bacterium]
MTEPDGRHRAESRAPARVAALGQTVGHTRFVVLLPVIAVLLVAFSLFLLGTIEAITIVWRAWAGVLRGTAEVSELSVTFLKTVSIMLEAVVAFLVGVGLYSLFIGPLNLAISLGVDTLNDLEERVISVVVTVLGVTFLEHFIQWRDPLETLQFGAALAVAVAALVLFQFYSHRSNEDEKAHHPDTQERSRRDMFQRDQEQHDIRPDAAARRDRDAAHKDPGAPQGVKP